MDLLAKDTLLTVSRREFFELWRKYSKQSRNRQLLDQFKGTLGCSISSEQEKLILREILKTSKVFDRKWEQSFRKRSLFFARNENWLDGNAFQLSLSGTHQEKVFITSNPSLCTVGRPKLVTLAEASKKTKLRRVQDLVETRAVLDLTTAAEVAVRKSGKRDAANMIKTVTSCSPGTMTRIKKSLEKSSERKSRPLSNEEALAYYIDSKSTSHSYKQTRKYALRTGNKVFPSYYSLQKAKKKCYPSEDNIFITETTAEISVKAILDKTTERLVHAYEEVFLQSDLSVFTLMSKWGGDGSSGHSNYKQKFSDQHLTDEYLFVYCLVPIRLHNHEDSSLVLWQNPNPSSTRLCRPIKFAFCKETTQFVLEETQKIQQQINDNLSTEVTLSSGGVVTIHHKLLLTMVDGKICNILSENTSSQRCFICGCSSSEMNKITLTRPPVTENYGFGLSTLHAWIRCFECFLHISYKLEHKKWRLNSSLYEERKKEIQKQFKIQMGLIVDKPKPGFGSSNDGNTARRFFRDSEKSASITGLDANLLQKFDTILRVISSGHEVNTEEFEKFATETRELYLRLYSWYNMPATVHKILNHGTAIIKHHLLPVGQLSEEAQEARNKDCRRFREHHTRKNSRYNTNRDLLNMLLLTSDPLINVLREQPLKKKDALPKQVLSLLSQAPASIPPSTSRTLNEVDLDIYIVLMIPLVMKTQILSRIKLRREFMKFQELDNNGQ